MTRNTPFEKAPRRNWQEISRQNPFQNSLWEQRYEFPKNLDRRPHERISFSPVPLGRIADVQRLGDQYLLFARREIGDRIPNSYPSESRPRRAAHEGHVEAGGAA